MKCCPMDPIITKFVNYYIMIYSIESLGKVQKIPVDYCLLFNSLEILSVSFNKAIYVNKLCLNPN